MHRKRSLPLLFRKTLLSLIATSLLILICYFWIDPLVAYWVDHQSWKQSRFFRNSTHLADGINLWSFFYYCYFAWAFPKQNPSSLLPRENRSSAWPGLTVANSVAIAVFIKDALKIPFGRYWPTTWTNNNPSLLHDHAYGFHWFHQGVMYQSFPSGHTAVAVAFMIALWQSYPHGLWKWGGVLLAALIVIGLLACNYHFMGDLLGGAWVGAVVAYYTHATKEGHNSTATKNLPLRS